MKTLLLSAAVCMALQSFAQAQEEDTTSASLSSSASIRQMAIEETAIVPSEVKAHPTDVSVTGGMLTLKENKPEVHLRSWDYFLSLSAQSFAPAGTATNDYGTRFNLNETSTTVMPALALGIVKHAYESDNLTVAWGVGGKVSYSSQNAPVTMPNGFLIDDARLNTTELGLNPFVRVGSPLISWLEVNAGYILGSLNYAETSTNDFAKFSRTASFQGYNLGADFRLSRRWSILVDYSHKSLNASNDIDIQNNNVEVGTRVQW